MSEIIVRTHVRKVVEEIDQQKVINISNDFFVELCKKVEDIVKDSCKRARANGRNTVMGKDL